MTRNYDVQDTASWCVFVPPPRTERVKGWGDFNARKSKFIPPKKWQSERKSLGSGGWSLYNRPLFWSRKTCSLKNVFDYKMGVLRIFVEEQFYYFHFVHV